MELTFRWLSPADVRAIIAWHYEKPYDVYNIVADDEEINSLIDFYTNPANHGYAIDDERGDFVAFCSFGEDGQVPGGDYSTVALDIGMGVRPDLTGRGLGGQFASAVIEFAAHTFAPQASRVTIAQFNTRAQRVWMGQEFQPTQTFESSGSKMTFVVMTRTVSWQGQWRRSGVARP